MEGDLLRLGAGDQVVVDGPLVGPGRLEADESLLTGESEPVVKRAGDRLLSGSYVLSGTAHQEADAVGEASYAASLTSAARVWTPHRTPLQTRIDLVVRVAMLLVALMSATILLQAALEGLSLLRVAQTSAVLSGLVEAGLVARRSNQRLDSTHVLGLVAKMSRLECVREALRLALRELAEAMAATGEADRPTLPVVVYELISRPGEANFGMALAASVVLGVLTVVVMALVERLRLGSVGTF